MGRLPGVLVAGIMMAVVLAGCASESGADEPAEVVDPDSFELETGKGAIDGLLVDDRFRPIDLQPAGAVQNEFQTAGFILVQETGQQVQTNENGEFSVIDLEPGTYTLRLSADGIEAAPERVTVQEGLFNEAQIIGRRTAGTEDVIITQEHAAFVSCFSNFVAYSFALECTNDQSGDTDRADWIVDNSEFNGTLEYVVIEVLFDNPAPPSTAYDYVARQGPVSTDFSSGFIPDNGDRYGKMHLPVGRVSPDPVPVGGGCDAAGEIETNCPYHPDLPLQTIIFGRGFGHEEIRTTYAPVYGALNDNTPCAPVPIFACVNHVSMRRGVGGALGVQATYLMSLFLFDPEADGTLLHETDYCVLCDPDA